MEDEVNNEIKQAIMLKLKIYLLIGAAIMMGFAILGFAVVAFFMGDGDEEETSFNGGAYGQLEGMDLYNADGSVNKEAISQLENYLQQNYLGGVSKFSGNRAYAQASREYAEWWKYDAKYNHMEKFQCTWWARGRANQYLESIGKEKISGSTGNGGQVIENLKRKGYKTGTEPRPNSLITWAGSASNSYGHIAFVEAVDKDGTIYFSHAGGGRSWYGITALKPNYDYAGMAFQGFIYLSDEDVTINNGTGGGTNSSTSITVLVNAHNPLPESTYGSSAGDPSNLTTAGGERMNSEAASAYNQMVAAAKADGVTLTICSGYRTYAEQNSKYQSRPGNVDIETTASYYQGPLTSEHRTGLAIDFGSVQSGVTGNWNTWLSRTNHKAMFNWLYKHAHEYGFILRYPSGSESITGIMAESWHYRYIGPTHAKKFKEKSKSKEVTSGGVTYSKYTYEEYHQQTFGSGNYYTGYKKVIN